MTGLGMESYIPQTDKVKTACGNKESELSFHNKITAAINLFPSPPDQENTRYIEGAREHAKMPGDI